MGSYWEKSTIFGGSLEQGKFQAKDKDVPFYLFSDSQNGSFMAVYQQCAHRHVLLVGGSGSGKTNVMCQMILQARHLSDQFSDVFFIFDTKGDFISHRGFRRPNDYVIGNSAQFRNQSVVWNLFDEVLADGDDPFDVEANAREIASELFKDRGSQTQPFFANAAKDIFANLIVVFIRLAQQEPSRYGDRLNNADFIAFLKGDPKVIRNHLLIYEDTKGLLGYIGDGTSNQALGVFGELRSMLEDCFRGVFAAKPTNPSQSFSVRRAVRQKGGRAIFLEYDLMYGETMTPIYRLLTDLALKEALSERASGRTHLFLDELKLLPKVGHLEDALNFGRSKRVCVIGGLQSVSQINATYGEEVGATILGGFSSVIAFRTSDYATREYLSNFFGPNITAYRYYTNSGEPIDREREGHVVEHWDIQRLRIGQAIVGLSTQDQPFLFQFSYDPF